MNGLEKQGVDLWSDPTPYANAALNLSIHHSEKMNNPQALRFLNLLAEGEAVTFQTFDDNKDRKDPKLIRILHGTLEENLFLLEKLNDQGAGVFVTVNQTDLQGRGTKNITKVRAVFVDLDGSSLEPILSTPLEPQIIIESSPKRYHAYWLIDDLAIGDFTYVQKALIKRFQSDPAVHDLPRVMRVPGFYHQKEKPFFTHIFSESLEKPHKAEVFLKSFEIDLRSKETQFKPELGLNHDPFLFELEKRGMVKRPLPNKPGGWDILCPFANLHTTGEDGTAYFETYTNGYKGVGFKCQHTHCAEKDINDLKKYLGLEAYVIPNKNWEDPIPLSEKLKPVQSFDETILPNAIRHWIMDIAERMQVPPDFLAATVIVVLSSLIGRKIGIFPKAKDDWLVTPNLWGAVVGRPSLLKSPAIAEIMKLLDALASDAIKKHQVEIDQYEKQLLWHEAKKQACKDELKKLAKKKEINAMPEINSFKIPSEPSLKRYKTEDGTVEKIGEILLKNPQGILIHRDELVGWLKSLDKYGREADRAFYLESWNGNGPYTVDRIARGTLHIPALCLSIIGGIQPGPLGQYIYQAANGGNGDDGLLQRFQLLVWPDAPNSWENVDRLPNAVEKEKAYRIIKKLDEIEPFEPEQNQVFKTLGLHFSADAQNEFDIWRHGLEHKLRSGELSAALESHLAKYRSLMPSLALIFCLVETEDACFPPKEVDLKSSIQAIKWCDYLETHASRLYASTEDPSMESARVLFERIRRGDLKNGFSIREVYHSKHWSKLDTEEKVSGAIKILEEFGWVKKEMIETGGRKTTKIYTHPSIKNNIDKEIGGTLE